MRRKRRGRLAAADLEAALAEARALSAYWEREAVLRTSSIASRLGLQVVAGRRLFGAVERLLAAAPDDVEARNELIDAARYFRGTAWP